MKTIRDVAEAMRVLNEAHISLSDARNLVESLKITPTVQQILIKITEAQMWCALEMNEQEKS
jgi:hypothetical protein